MAKLRILACILGVPFDDLRRREDERRKRKLVSWSMVVACLLLVCGGLVSRMLTERSRADEERAKAMIAAAKAQSEAEASRRSQYFTQIRQAEDELREGAQTRLLERLEACPPDLRGWEWYRLRNLHSPTNQQATVFKLDNRMNIYSVSLSRDGRWIALDGHLFDLRLGTKGLTLDHARAPVIFSPDSKRIAARISNRAAILDAETGTEVMSLVEQITLYQAAYSPNGQQIVLATDQGLKAFNSNTGKEMWTVPGYTLDAHALLFSPDSKEIIVAKQDGELRVFEAITASPFHTKRTDLARLTSAAISPDGRRLVTIGVLRVKFNEVATAQFWNIERWPWTLVRTLPAPEYTLFYSTAFSTDGRVFATGGTDPVTAQGGVTLWDASNGARTGFYPMSSYQVHWIGFSADGLRLVAEAGGKVYVWTYGGGQAKDSVLVGHKNVPFEIQFSPDSRRIISRGQFSVEGKMWDVARQTLLLDFEWGSPHPRGDDSKVAFSPDGSRLAITVCGQHQVLVCDTTTGAVLIKFPGHPKVNDRGRGGVNCVVFSPDGKSILTAGNDKMARVWNATTGEQLMALENDEYPVANASYSLDGKLIITTSWSPYKDAGRTRVWDATSGTSLLSLKGADLQSLKRLRSAAPLQPQVDDIARKTVPAARTGNVAPDPTSHYDFRSYTSGGDFGVKVFDAVSGAQLLDINPAHSPIAVSVDGRRIAFGGPANTVRLWDSSVRGAALTLRGHTDSIKALAFSPDGNRLVSGSQDQTVRVWDVVTGAEALTLRGHQGAVLTVVFSPDNRYIASSGGDKTVRIWDSGGARY